MAINKVIDRNGNTLIDLTADTISPNKVLSGTKFHGPDGKEYIGSLPVNELNTLKYTFVDYDGTVLYTFTDEELDALTELPAGPDHTDDNLTFQEWNWSLEDLKSVDRTRPDRPLVGANLITSDEKTYITLVTSPDNRSEDFVFLYIDTAKPMPVINVDWGDGTSESFTPVYNQAKSHTFPEANTEYIITFDVENAENCCFGVYNTNYISFANNYGGDYVTSIKLGRFGKIGYGSKLISAKINKINIPKNTTLTEYHGLYNIAYLDCIVLNKDINTDKKLQFKGASISLPNIPVNLIYDGSKSLKNIFIPDSVISMETNAFNNCRILENCYIPDSVTSIGNSAFYYCYSLKSVRLSNNIKIIPGSCFYDASNLQYVNLPDGISEIKGSAFYNCSALRNLKVPDSVTAIGSYAFNGCYNLTLDLSEQTKVIQLTTSSIGTFFKIIVPASLLDQYKAASYWSNYADYMVGV